MAGDGAGDGSAQALLSALIQRVADKRVIADLLAPNVDADEIEMELRPVGTGGVSIDSITGNESRIDAVVTIDLVVARIVFARNEDGLVTWLHTYVKPAPFPGLAGGLVIVVNGPSGAGKPTLMRSLQSVARFPLVVLDEPEHIGIVQPGYLIWRDSAPALHRGYLAAIAALAGAGNHVTLSAAGHTYDEIVKAFSDVQVISVGMRCDFDVLVDREQRTGRWAGIAAQSLGVHDGWTYDLEIDTTNGPDPLELARRVFVLVSAARSPVRLSDDAVVLRPWSVSDAIFMAEASRDPAIERYNGPVPASVADATTVIERIEQNWRTFEVGGDPTGVAFVIVDATLGEPVGMCGIDQWSSTDGAQFGYWLAAGARGRGLATRAVTLMTGWLFKLGAARVFLTIDSENTASAAVALRAGFTYEGMLRASDVWAGERKNVDVFTVLPDEWPVEANR